MSEDRFIGFVKAAIESKEAFTSSQSGDWCSRISKDLATAFNAAEKIIYYIALSEEGIDKKVLSRLDK